MSTALMTALLQIKHMHIVKIIMTLAYQCVKVKEVARVELFPELCYNSCTDKNLMTETEMLSST